MVGTSNKSVPELAIERWTFWGWSELYKDMMKSVQRLFRLGVFIFRGNHGFSTSFWNSLPCLPWRKIRFQTTGVGETSCKFFCMFHRNRQVHEQRTEALERSIQAAPRNRKIAGGWPSVDMQASDFLCGSLWRKMVLLLYVLLPKVLVRIIDLRMGQNRSHNILR